jgi:hypothetical protein
MVVEVEADGCSNKNQGGDIQHIFIWLYSQNLALYIRYALLFHLSGSRKQEMFPRLSLIRASP